MTPRGGPGRSSARCPQRRSQRTSTASPSGRSWAPDGKGSPSTRCSMEWRRQPSTSLPTATATTPPIYPWRMSRVARDGWLLPTRANPLSQSTADRPACWCRTCTSGRVPSGSGDCSSLPTTSPASGRPWATTTTGTPGESSATGETEAVAVQPRRTLWRLAEVIEVVAETPRTKTLLLEVPGWEGHKAGQHVDVRLTAEDGYQTQRSYSIASAPEDERLMLTVDRLDDGEVSIYLTEVLMAGDELELRGPIGGYFTWEERDGGPLFLVGGGSGIAPLMAMIRHRAAAGSDVLTMLLYSSRSYEEIIFREELETLASRDSALEVIHTLTRSRPEGWTGYHRRIDAEMLREVAWSPDESPLAFVCGPTLLVEGVADALVRLGHDPARVKTERFGPTGG